MSRHYLPKHFYLLAILLASLVTCGFMYKQKPPSFSPAPFLAKQSVSYISRKSSLQQKSEKPEQNTGGMVKSLLFTKKIFVAEVQRTWDLFRPLYSVEVLGIFCFFSFLVSFRLLQKYNDFIHINTFHGGLFVTLYKEEVTIDKKMLEEIDATLIENDSLPPDLMRSNLLPYFYHSEKIKNPDPISPTKNKKQILCALMILSIVAINVYYYLFQHKKVHKTATLKRYFNCEVLLANIFLLFFSDVLTKVYYKYIASVLYGKKQVQQQNILDYFQVENFYIAGQNILNSVGEFDTENIKDIIWQRHLSLGGWENNYQVVLSLKMDFLDKNRNSVCTAYALFTCPRAFLDDVHIKYIENAVYKLKPDFLPLIIRSITHHFLKKKQNSLLAHIRHACVQMSSLSVLIRFWQTFFIFCGLFFSFFYVGFIREEEEKVVGFCGVLLLDFLFWFYT